MKRYSWLILILIFILTPRLWADDTDIYGTTAITVTPNVLIIFDTSGSMGTEDVIGEYYDKDTTYSGTYTQNGVYRWKDHSYQWFADDIEDLNCPPVKTALQNDGHVRDEIYSSNGGYACGGKNKSLYLGNWLNYDASGVGTPKSRKEVAKEVIKQLITTTENVNFGLMRFNPNQGGHIIAPFGTDKATLLSIVDGLPSSGYTPLAETLAEAGLYFAGKKSWFNDSDGYNADCDINGNGCYQYTTPMTSRCQKNYIILMTDGEPTYDGDTNAYIDGRVTKLVGGTYINGDTIGDYDNDGVDPGSYGLYGSDYLDDVAKYLYDNDLNPNLGTLGESFEKQNVSVYTIGFKTEQQLLSETAQNGGGLYYTANSISGLSAAFAEIIADIADVSAVFVSPVVPVSRMNRTFAGNSLYVGFFKPKEDGKWAGNIKKFGIDYHGNIIDSLGVLATLDNGEIKDNARSYWSDSADGGDVLLGGLGGVLKDQTADSRTIYTYISGTGLTDFSKTNSLITADVLDVGATEKDGVIDDIRGVGKTWKLGDILHSRPSVVHYDTDGNGSLDEALLFAGSNDGIMHCFKDSDGSEMWGFIPPNLLPRLQELSDGTTTHKYFVDGVPRVYEGNNKKILFFGERRGGNQYYALNVTTYNLPVYLYSVGQTFLTTEDGNNDIIPDGDGALLGQSWSEPTTHTIKKSSGSDKETVFLLAGGYDENQDKPLPANPPTILSTERAENDTIGRAVFTINVETGVLSKLDVNAGYYSAMTHSIVDVSGFDSNGNGITNRVYAGDLGGNMFAFDDDDGDGTWSQRKFFSAPVEASTARRKIFYSPDAVEETYGEMIFFGTGDRADPEGSSVVNRVYAIKNNWEDLSTFTTLSESDLYDATLDLIILGSLTEQANAHTQLADKDGWFIKLDQNTGEKVTSPVVVFNGVAYFTTYTPESGPAPDPSVDPCEVVSGRGVARLYALNYKTGEAAFEWSDIEETDGTDEHNVVPKGRWDRSKIIGTSIASAPVIAILEGGPQIYIGVEGGVKKEDPDVTKTMETFFWRQINN